MNRVAIFAAVLLLAPAGLANAERPDPAKFSEGLNNCIASTTLHMATRIDPREAAYQLCTLAAGNSFDENGNPRSPPDLAGRRQ
jgi:hypothetical protein